MYVFMYLCIYVYIASGKDREKDLAQLSTAQSFGQLG